MALDFDTIEARLALLKELGIEEFECEDFRVKFTPYYPESITTTTVTETVEGVPERKSLFENERLWPNGQPPSFFKKDP